MRSIQHLKCLAILTAVELAAHGAGLNMIPALPQQASSSPNSEDSESDGFWYTSWNTPPLRSWKGVDLRTTLDYRAFYTDNPRLSPGTHKGDYMHYLSPLIGVSRSFETEQRATLVSISYQPTFVVSSLGNGRDQDYHLVRGELSHLWNEKTVYLSHQFQESSESSTQAAFLTPQQENRTLAGFRTPLTGKISADFGFEQTVIDSAVPSSADRRQLRNWISNTHIDYQLKPKLQTGVRMKFGYSEQAGVASAARYFSESLVSTWSYQVSGKISASLDAGGQIVQSQTASVRDPEPTPIASGGLIYEPRYGTSLSLNGGRSANASQFFSGSFVTESGLDLSVRQRIYQDFLLSGRFAYSVGEYSELDPSATKVSRDYSYYTLTANLQWRINARIATGIFYQYLSRDSNLSTESYSASQVGASLSLSL